MDIQRWDPEIDGELSEGALWQKIERLGYSVHRYVYAPNACFPTHAHTDDKIDAVVSGQFLITMGQASVILGPGDAVRVPQGAQHSAEVVGTEPVVSLDGIKRRR